MQTVRVTHSFFVGFFAVMMVLVAGAAASQEQRKAPNRQRQAWWENRSVQQELGLSANQVSAIAAIEERNRDSTRVQRKSQQKAYRTMIRLLTSGDATEDEIATARQGLEDAWTESIRENVAHWIELREELSSEQWEMLPKVAPQVLQLGAFRMRAMGTFRIGEEGE
jgi:Spy/CpxP family protein refolding chaperone